MYDISHKYPFLKGAYCLSYYKPKKTGDHDLVSSSVLAFKNGEETSLTVWTNYCIQAVNLLEDSPDIVIRVLGSSEKTPVSGTPLDILGRKIAVKCGAEYVPAALSKSKINEPLHSLGGKIERENELKGIYNYHDIGQPMLFPKILLIDDIVTTGSTIKEIYRAIHSVASDAQVYFMVLGKTASGPERSNDKALSFINGSAAHGSLTIEKYFSSGISFEALKKAIKTSAKPSYEDGFDLEKLFQFYQEFIDDQEDGNPIDDDLPF